MIAGLIDKIKEITYENFPDLSQDYFKPGNTPLEIESLEIKHGFELPEQVKEYLLLFGGEGTLPGKDFFQIGTFLGLSALTLEEIERELQIWKEVVEQNVEFEEIEYQSLPEGAVKTKYALPDFWVGLATDGSGNSIGVDLSPGQNGKYGQVIIWGRDFDDYRIVAFDTWQDFLKQLVQDLKNKGFYTIDREYNVYELKEINYLDHIHDSKLEEYRGLNK